MATILALFASTAYALNAPPVNGTLPGGGEIAPQMTAGGFDGGQGSFANLQVGYSSFASISFGSGQYVLEFNPFIAHPGFEAANSGGGQADFTAQNLWSNNTVGAGFVGATWIDAGAGLVTPEICLSGVCDTSWPTSFTGNQWLQASALDYIPVDAGIGVTVAAVDAGVIYSRGNVIAGNNFETTTNNAGLIATGSGLTVDIEGTSTTVPVVIGPVNANATGATLNIENGPTVASFMPNGSLFLDAGGQLTSGPIDAGMVVDTAEYSTGQGTFAAVDAGEAYSKEVDSATINGGIVSVYPNWPSQTLSWSLGVFAPYGSPLVVYSNTFDAGTGLAGDCGAGAGSAGCVDVAVGSSYNRTAGTLFSVQNLSTPVASIDHAGNAAVSGNMVVGGGTTNYVLADGGAGAFGYIQNSRYGISCTGTTGLTSPSLDANSGDIAGKVCFTGVSNSYSAGVPLFTCNFAAQVGELNATSFVLPDNQATALLMNPATTYVGAETTTEFALYSATTIVTTGITYCFKYLVVGQ